MRDNWEDEFIENIFNVSSGTGLSEAKFKPGDDKVYGGSGIIGFHNEYTNKNPELIVGRVGAHCGNIYLTRRLSWITDNALIISFSEKNIYYDFWYYLLTHLHLRNYAFQSAQPVITGGILKKIKLKFPPLPQQQKIAQILSTCDAVLEKTEAAIAKYKAIKQGLLHDLFTRGIDPATGELRPSYEESPELYKETELGFVPMDWAVEEFGEFIEAIDPQPSHRTPPEFPNGVPYLGINDIKNGEIQFSKCRKVSPEVLEEHLNRYSISDGDIIFGKIGTIGEPKRLVDPQVYTLSANVILIKPSKNKDLIFHYLNSSIVVSQILRKIHTTSQPAFGIEKIRSLLIPDIPIDEANNLENKFNSIDRKIESENRSLAKYQAVKAGLMQDLLSGAVGVEGLLEKDV